MPEPFLGCPNRIAFKRRNNARPIFSPLSPPTYPSMSHVNTSNRYSAKRRAYAETSTRERHANDRASHERPPPVETDPDDDENFDNWERMPDHSPASTCPRDEAHAVRNPNHPEGRSTTDRERRRSNDVSLAIRENKRRKKSV